MFRCSDCGKTTLPNEKATHVIAKSRKVTYPCGSTGTEIVKEVLICQQCAIIRDKNSKEVS